MLASSSVEMSWLDRDKEVAAASEAKEATARHGHSVFVVLIFVFHHHEPLAATLSPASFESDTSRRRVILLSLLLRVLEHPRVGLSAAHSTSQISARAQLEDASVA